MPNPLDHNERRSLQIRKLTEVSRALTYAISLDDVLSLTVARASEILNAKKSVLMLTNDDGLLSVRASHGIDPTLCEKFQFPLDESLVHRLQGILGADAKTFLGVPLVAAGKVIGLLCVGRRETQGQEDEEEWLLSALADQAAVALEKTRLDEAAQFRERLLGIVGHDLRNPLQAIQMAAQALLNGDQDERSQKLTDRISRSSERMNEMITQLLDFTRTRLGAGIELEFHDVDLIEITRQCLEEVELAYPRATLQLEAEKVLVGRWDSERLSQVISNLIANAIQHGDTTKPIQVRIFAQSDMALIQVQNAGRSIPSEQVPHLFDPFQQGNPMPSHSRGRLGLGLYIVKEIITAHHGDISVVSTDSGTTFTVKIPICLLKHKHSTPQTFASSTF